MNCLEFHRQKLANPRRLSAPALAHHRQCASCAAFARSVDETERTLGHALAVPVPEGLAERALLHARSAARTTRRRWLLAASVVLPATIGGALFWKPLQQDDRYARLAIEHVVMEPESLTTVRNADPGALDTIVKDFGGVLKEQLGQIRYIKLCPVGEGTGWHIVFDTGDGLATLFLVPEQRLGATQSVSAAGWSALARPTRGGYYAVVTASPAATSRVDSLLRTRVAWDG